MGNTEEIIREREIAVDSRGRTSLAKVMVGDFTHYRVKAFSDGTLVLTPVLTVTPDELAELRRAAGQPAA